MINLDYYIGHKLWSKKQKKAFLEIASFIKLWLERISFVAIVAVILAVLFYPFMDDTSDHKSYSSKDPLDNILVELDKNEIFQKAENKINYKAKEKQDIQISNITKKIATNKVMIPNSVVNTDISRIKNIEPKTIEDKPEATFTSNKPIKELTQSSDSKSSDIDDIKDLQGIYQESLDQLTYEEQFEDLLKNKSSKYLDIIEL